MKQNTTIRTKRGRAVDDGVELLRIDHAIHPPPDGRDKNDLGVVPVLLRGGEDGQPDGEDLVAVVPERDQEFVDQRAVQVKLFSALSRELKTLVHYPVFQRQALVGNDSGEDGDRLHDAEELEAGLLEEPRGHRDIREGEAVGVRPETVVPRNRVHSLGLQRFEPDRQRSPRLPQHFRPPPEVDHQRSSPDRHGDKEGGQAGVAYTERRLQHIRRVQQGELGGDPVPVLRGGPLPRERGEILPGRVLPRVDKRGVGPRGVDEVQGREDEGQHPPTIDEEVRRRDAAVQQGGQHRRGDIQQR